jgi:probable F420-dependent oxidoreductase
VDRVEIGFAVPVAGSWATPDNQRHVARRAEELGYASLWTFQRLLFPAAPQGPRWTPAYRSVLDPTVTLAFLAGQTTRIRLGVAVLDIPFFSPALLAKQLTTLDIVSGGRLDAGLGLGWSTEEYAAAGTPYQRRGRRAEEFLQVLLKLWSEPVVDFQGEFYTVPAARSEPKPVQRPHPPLLLGASADAALERAGRLAEGWVSSSGADLTRIGVSIGKVRAAAQKAGRDADRLRFVSRGVIRVRPARQPDRLPLSGSFEEIRGDLDLLREQGVTEVFLDLNFDPEVGSPDADPAASIRRATEVLEEFAPAP